MSQNIIQTVDEKIATLTINRPDKLNALDAQTITELFHFLKKLKEDEGIRAIIITGQGEKAFVAGAEINELTKHDDISGRIFSLRGQKVFRFIEKFEKPVIAAINGYALGGGLELAMACHIRLASRTAKFGQPEINLGLIPGYGGTQRLPRLIGQSRAVHLLLTGEIINAEKAFAYGLISEIHELEELLPAAEKLAKLLAEKPPIAVACALRSVMEGVEINMDAGLNLEADLFGALCATEDMKEGTTAFLEKRPAKFKGK